TTTAAAGALCPTATRRPPPITRPIAAPPRARTAVDSVEAALVRSTDSVPSTTQKPCCTLLRSATATATASATEPRTLLTNQTERTLAERRAAEASLDTLRAARAPTPDPRYQRRRSAAIHSGSAFRDATSASAPIDRTATAIVWAWKDSCAART